MTAWRRYLQRQERREDRRADRRHQARVRAAYNDIQNQLPDGWLVAADAAGRPIYRHPDGSWQREPA